MLGAWAHPHHQPGTAGTLTKMSKTLCFQRSKISKTLTARCCDGDVMLAIAIHMMLLAVLAISFHSKIDRGRWPAFPGTRDSSGASHRSDGWGCWAKSYLADGFTFLCPGMIKQWLKSLGIWESPIAISLKIELKDWSLVLDNGFAIAPKAGGTASKTKGLS